MDGQTSKKEMIHDLNKEYRGPYVFKIHGETYHVISNNLPEDGKNIRFLHLYK